MQWQVKTVLNAIQPFAGFVYRDIRLPCHRDGQPRCLAITVRAQQGRAARCSRCRKPAPGYDQLPQRWWLFVPLWGIVTWFLYAARRVHCPEHGVVVEHVPWSDGKRPVTIAMMCFLSRAYQEGFKGAHKDAIIGLGTAPLEDAMFRSATFEQLGETKLEGAVTTDICGKRDSHATRLDAEAQETIKNTRLHRKVATTIFFESNGGQAKADATQPEIRFAAAEPGLDMGNVETALEALTEACYYLTVERNRYHFSLKENLNKRFADRRATIPPAQIEEYVRGEVQKVFAAGAGVERVYFPEKTIQVADRPAIALVVLAPDQTLQDEKATTQCVETMLREYGNSARTFKNGLIFSLAESAEGIRDDARKLLAWEAIEDDDLKLDESQIHQLAENSKKARRDLKETVWRSYKVLMLLGKDNALKRVDLGLIHSSAAPDILSLIMGRLGSEGDVESKGISPTTLIRNWPPAFREWSTKSVRDAFFASPQFPRLTNPEVLKDTIVRGVGNGMLAYVCKTASGTYKPFYFNQALMTADVEFLEDMFVITKESAEAFLRERAAPAAPAPSPPIAHTRASASVQTALPIAPSPASSSKSTSGLTWTGEIPPQKWMNFYMKVLAKFASARGLKLTVKVEATPEGGVSPQKLDETKSALRELGLHDKVDPL